MTKQQAEKKTVKFETEVSKLLDIVANSLYTEKEIFLRELISNSSDACEKLRYVSQTDSSVEKTKQFEIRIHINEKNKTISIKDNGIGMTAEEIDKYINQIAFSGAEEFVKKYEGKEGAEQIIGHFGLGFYSAFMVADKVQIKTLSRHEGSQAVQWESNGDPEYTITDIDKKDRGTEIVLHITKESKEFLEKERIAGILNKYCKF